LVGGLGLGCAGLGGAGLGTLGGVILGGGLNLGTAGAGFGGDGLAGVGNSTDENTSLSRDCAVSQFSLFCEHPVSASTSTDSAKTFFIKTRPYPSSAKFDIYIL
jgi:hypothetical protein